MQRRWWQRVADDAIEACVLPPAALTFKVVEVPVVPPRMILAEPDAVGSLMAAMLGFALVK